MDTANSTTSMTLSSETTPLLELTSSGQCHASRLPRTKTISCPVICLMFGLFCTQLVVFSILGILNLFATDKEQLDLTPTYAFILTCFFFGTCCFTPVLGGWLADSKLGKFSVILYGTFFDLIGTILLLIGSITNSPGEEWAATSVTTNTAFKRAVYITGLTFVAFGTGGILANVSIFAAEQVSNNAPDTMRSLYSWCYWFLNLSALLAYTFVIHIQKNISYFYGNLVPMFFLVLALIVFLASKSIYIIYPPYGSVILETLTIVKEAIKKSRRSSISGASPNHWLDQAKTCFGGSFTSWEVDDVKKIYRLLPIYATLIFYYAVYSQIFTAMMYQGAHMNTSVGLSDPLPVGFPIIADILAIFLLLPFMEKVFYPFFAKFNICPSQLQRIGIGMLFATASMACSGVLEWYRVKRCCIEQERGNKNFTGISSITILYQVPQYLLVGFSEIFTIVTAFEFAYIETPKYFQGVVFGLLSFLRFLGSLVVGFLVLIVNEVTKAIDGPNNQWYPDEDHINNGHHLANYFFLLAVLMFLDFIWYIYVALRFKPKRESEERANLQSINSEV